MLSWWRVFLPLCLWMGVVAPMFGQSLTGQLIDASTGDPLPGVTVSTSNDGTVTNSNGVFQLDVQTAVSLRCSYIGYMPLDTTLYPPFSDTVRLIMTPSQTLLQQVVVTSSRFEKSLGEVVASLEVMDANTIAQHGNTSLDDVLERLSGVTIIDGQPNIRGGSGYSYGAGSRVLLLLDNMPILTGDAGFPNWSFLPMEHVAQVEVSKGAASVLYGSSALNGVINLRTAYPGRRPETNVRLLSGVYAPPADSQQRWYDDRLPLFTSLELSHRQRMGPLDMVLGGMVYAEDSYLQNDYTRRGRFSVATRHRLPNVRGLTAGIHSNVMWSNSTNFFMWENANSGAFRPLPNTLSTNQGMRYNVDPFVQYVTKNGARHRWQSRLFFTDNKTNANQNNRSTLFFGEYQYQHPFPAWDMTLVTGLVGNGVRSISQLYGDSVHTSDNAALYVQLEKKWWDQLTVVGGARYERNQINRQPVESRPVFRFGANWQAAKYTYFRASWGQGYRYPTIAEQFIRTDIGLISIFPNPNLESEEGYSAEIGIKQGFQIDRWKGMVDVAVFHTAYSNMIEFSFGGTDGTLFGFQSVNVGDTRITGGEITLQGAGQIGTVPFRLMGGYVYIDPRYANFDSTIAALSSSDENILKYRFKHTASFIAQTQWQRFNVGVAGRYYSRMAAIDFVFEQLIPGVAEYRDTHTGGDWVWDVNIHWQFTEFLSMDFIVRNVFNNNYSLRPAIMEAPRQFVVRLNAQMTGKRQ